MSGRVTLEDVKAWLVIADSIDDDTLTKSLDAANAYVETRCTLTDDAWPEEVRNAVRLLTARYLARRNSPDGLVGFADVGPVTLPYRDADVARLIAPWRDWAMA